MLIAISRFIKPLNELDQIRQTHLLYLKKLTIENKLLISGRQQPPRGGVIIAKIDSIEEFQALLNEDPYVKENAASYDIIQFTPSVYDNKLKEILFKTE